jgi:hypothetical protein
MRGAFYEKLLQIVLLYNNHVSEKESVMFRNSRDIAIMRLTLAVVAIAGLVGQVSIFVARQLPLANLFSYFTVQANILAIVLLLILAYFGFSGLSQESLKPYRGAVTLYLVIVGIVYFFFLRGTNDQATLPWVNAIMHYIVPLGMLTDWLIFPPLGVLELKRALKWLIYPIMYVVYSLIRGYITGWYPYAFLDPTIIGYVLVFAATIILAVICLGIIRLLLLARNKIQGKR